MPSKRKTRTHIFQRTRARSRRRSCSQSKGKGGEETDDPVDVVDVASEVETSHQNDDEISHQEKEVGIGEQIGSTNAEEETEEEDTITENDESQNASVEITSQKSDKKACSKSPAKVSSQPNITIPTQNTTIQYKNLYKKSPRRAHRYKSYSHEMLVAAYKCVKDLKMPVKAAARMFGVPSSTLHNRVQGQVQIDDSIISSADVVRLTERLKNGEGLDDAFAGLTYEKSNGDVNRSFVVNTEEDDINDESFTESIMEKMNISTDSPDIKEEIIDPEYDNQLSGTGQKNDDSYDLTDYQFSPSQEQMRRSYKRSYKTYSYEQLVAAYLYVKEKKVAVKFAARAFGVPPSTLNDRVQGKVFIDTSIVMNNPGGRKFLPKPNLNRFSRGCEKVKKDLRKVFNLTLEKKAELIEAVERGDKSKRELAQKYGIAPSTLSGIMVNKVKIMEAFHSQSFKPERKKFRKSFFHDLEEELLKYVVLWQTTNIPFNGPKLMEKAKEIAKKLDIPEFSGSNGWIDRFKNRNNIRFIPGCEVNKVFKEDRKITTLPLERKVELLEKVDKGEKSKKQLAEEFGIAPSTLSGIILNRDRIFEAYHSKSFGPLRKKFRRSTFQDVEADLLKWVEESHGLNRQIKSTELLAQAKTIAREKGIDNFSGSHSWIDRFRARNLQTFHHGPSELEDVSEKDVLNGPDSNQSDNQSENQSSNLGSDESAPPTPDASDISNSDSSLLTKQVYDSMEGRPEFQNIFKKHKCRDQYRKYTQEQLMEACKYSIETKASYREVSEKFGIPQSTLRDKLHAVEKLNAEVGLTPAKKARMEITDPSPESTVVLCPEAPEDEFDPSKLNAGANDRTNYRQYSKDSLTTAAHYVVKFNTPIMKAARMFGVPASTLKDHVKNKMTGSTETIVLQSSPSVISDRDERKLIEYIKMMEKSGFILTKQQIIDFGSELAGASQEIEGSITLSDSWYEDFVKRWPPLGLVNREGRSSTPHDIKKYFTELNKVFNKHKFFERPELVYVMDDVDIALEYNPLKLVPGQRFDRSKTSAKSTQQTLTSVIGCSNALGTALPPYYVLQSDEIVADVIGQSPPGTQATFAHSGPKDCSILRDYFQNHFIRFAQSGRNTQNRFVLVFYDSRKTDLNVSDLEWAKRWHILLHPLPHPVKTECASEIDTIDGMFRNYAESVEEERCQFVNQKGYMAVSMPDICGILGKAYRRSLSYEHIVSCFENWGVYPLNPKNYVAKLEVPFQLKLRDLQAFPNYETNLWLLSDFGCTQAVNNAIESSFNSCYSNESNTINYESDIMSNYRRQNSLPNISYESKENSGYNKDDTSFSSSYEGLMNHLMEQAVTNHKLPKQQILNGVAIKTEPQMDPSYGNPMESLPRNQNSYSNSSYVLERSVSSASDESQNTQNVQVVPQLPVMQLVQNGASSDSYTSLKFGALESTSSHGVTNSSDKNTAISLQSAEHVKIKCESSSSSRRKGKSYRVIVNEPEFESEAEQTETPPFESNIIFCKSKAETARKSGKLGSLLDEKVRKLHEQAKASGECNEDNDEPLMKVGDFQIVMNKGD